MGVVRVGLAARGDGLVHTLYLIPYVLQLGGLV